MKRIFLWIRLLILLVILFSAIAVGIIFAHDNPKLITVNLFGYTYAISVGVCLLLSFSLGIIIMWCVNTLIWLFNKVTFNDKNNTSKV